MKSALLEYQCKRTCQSSAITLIGYNQSNRTLLVIFRTGQAWEYSLIAPSTFQSLLRSESMGTSYRIGIRGQFPSEKWEPEKTATFLAAFEKAEREQLIKVPILELEPESTQPFSQKEPPHN